MSAFIEFTPIADRIMKFIDCYASMLTLYEPLKIQHLHDTYRTENLGIPW